MDPDAFWKKPQAYSKRKGDGHTFLRKDVAVAAALGFVGICVFVWIGLIGKPPSLDSSGYTNIRFSDKAKHALSHGTGYDWESLSAKEKVEVGLLCVERTGRHKAWTHVTFIDTFYSKARAEDPKLLRRDIAELAAVAAALDLKD